MASISLVVTEEKKFKNIESERSEPRSVNESLTDLGSDLSDTTHKASCIHLVDYIYQLLHHRLQ